MINTGRQADGDDPEPRPGADSRVERLFREHNATLVNFLRARLHSEADAREAAQEAYVRLLQLDQPEQPSFLRAYLFKVASNVATDLMRRRAVRGASDSSEVHEPWTPPTQERALGARQQLAVVDRALQELPAKCREAFLLRRQEGWKTDRIATHLGVSERMVRLYLVRSLEHLQRSLDSAND